MTKELSVVFVLTVLTALFWVGWAFFERGTVLNRLDFSAKSVQPIDPTLKIEILGE